jgi:hypothetical protein
LFHFSFYYKLKLPFPCTARKKSLNSSIAFKILFLFILIVCLIDHRLVISLRTFSHMLSQRKMSSKTHLERKRTKFKINKKFIKCFMYRKIALLLSRLLDSSLLMLQTLQNKRNEFFCWLFIFRVCANGTRQIEIEHREWKCKYEKIREGRSHA